jgi:chromosome segregation ATPase
LEAAEGKVEKELAGLRYQCGDLSRDKLLLELELQKQRRTKEHLENAHEALSIAKAEIQSHEEDASTRTAELREKEAELLRERQSREKAFAQDASNAAAREVGPTPPVSSHIC